LKLSDEASKELVNEESTMAQKVEENAVEAAKKAMTISEELKLVAAEEVGEILKTRMEIKRGQGSSEDATSDVGASALGNVTQTSLSEPIDLAHLHPHTTLHT